MAKTYSILAFALTCFIALCFTGCGDDKNEPNNEAKVSSLDGHTYLTKYIYIDDDDENQSIKVSEKPSMSNPIQLEVKFGKDNQLTLSLLCFRFNLIKNIINDKKQFVLTTIDCHYLLNGDKLTITSFSELSGEMDIEDPKQNFSIDEDGFYYLNSPIEGLKSDTESVIFEGTISKDKSQIELISDDGDDIERITAYLKR